MDKSVSDFFKQVSPLVLAYMGDAYIELLAREFLIGDGNCRTNKLNNDIKRFVTAKSQSEAAKNIETVLNESEQQFFKAGCNAKPKSMPKSATASEYMRATGLECLFGFLYFSHFEERARELFKLLYGQEGNT